METRFLTSNEHARLNRCPDELPREDLDAYFQLSPDDRVFINTYRTPTNRLGVALQGCCLRYLGFFPDNLTTLADPIVGYVAQQLGASPDLLSYYGRREKTRNSHQQRVLAHLGYRRAAPVDLLGLEPWLLDRALEHDRPKLLLELACDYLRRAKIVRPGVTTLARMVSAARTQAGRHVFEQLTPLLTAARRADLDKLVSSEETSRARLSWLQHTPTSNQTSAIAQTLDKLAFLDNLGVAAWDLGALNPNRLKWLAQKGSRLKPYRLQRLKDEVRLPLLVAFLHEALFTFTDAAVEMVDVRLWELQGESKREFKNDCLAATQTISDTLRVLSATGRLWLEDALAGASPPDVSHLELSPAQVEQALAQAENLIRPEQDAYVDYFATKHRKVQNFSKRLLEVMDYHASSPDEGLLEGLALVREIHAGVRRKLPSGTPTAFIPDVWRDEVFTEGGLNWRSYEIAALWVLRQKLRSGDVYTRHSRRHTELERYLIPKTAWSKRRTEAVGLTGTPLSADDRLRERYETLGALAREVEGLLTDKNSELRVEGERLVLSPLQQDETPAGLKRLRRLIEARLPRCDITDVLIEVDNWTGFSDALVHLDSAKRHDREALSYLYGCILAQACNLGFKQITTSADLAYERLLWYNRWHLRDDTLQGAVTTLVNYHHSLPFSSTWGGGVLSSSDGQRFPVSGDTRKARALPRYFGYGKGVTAYTWSSDLVLAVRQQSYRLDRQGRHLRVRRDPGQRDGPRHRRAHDGHGGLHGADFRAVRTIGSHLFAEDTRSSGSAALPSARFQLG